MFLLIPVNVTYNCLDYGLGHWVHYLMVRRTGAQGQTHKSTVLHINLYKKLIELCEMGTLVPFFGTGLLLNALNKEIISNNKNGKKNTFNLPLFRI